MARRLSSTGSVATTPDEDLIEAIRQAHAAACELHPSEDIVLLSGVAEAELDDFRDAIAPWQPSQQFETLYRFTRGAHELVFGRPRDLIPLKTILLLRRMKATPPWLVPVISSGSTDDLFVEFGLPGMDEPPTSVWHASEEGQLLYGSLTHYFRTVAAVMRHPDWEYRGRTPEWQQYRDHLMPSGTPTLVTETRLALATNRVARHLQDDETVTNADLVSNPYTDVPMQGAWPDHWDMVYHHAIATGAIDGPDDWGVMDPFPDIFD